MKHLYGIDKVLHMRTEENRDAGRRGLQRVVSASVIEKAFSHNRYLTKRVESRQFPRRIQDNDLTPLIVAMRVCSENELESCTPFTVIRPSSS